MATTRALTAPEDCLRIQTEDSAAAFSALCQAALNETVVSVFGSIMLTSSGVLFVCFHLHQIFV